jgi:glycosyltransferase involved in cell wall biosynthesis
VKIVHLEAGTHLYGGAVQVLLLVEGLQARDTENVLVVPSGSRVEEEAQRRNLPVRSLPMAGEADLVFPFRFRRLLREEEPDLVHLHSRRGADTLGALTARLAGVPSVLSRRVDNPEPGWSLAAKYRLYEAVITISSAIREVLVEQGVPEGRIRTVHSALDPAPFQAPCEQAAFRGEFGLPAEGPVVGMAAQFIPRKGHHVLLDAIPEVLSQHPLTSFLLFGQGPLLEEVFHRLEKEGLQDRVYLPGFRDDLPRILPCLDLLVHPAIREGLGIILLQASASGIPIVATRAGGIPEAVADGETGILVPPEDPGALARAISQLLSNPHRATAMGEAGRRRVRDHFSADRMVEGNLEVYRTVLGGR